MFVRRGQNGCHEVPSQRRQKVIRNKENLVTGLISFKLSCPSPKPRQKTRNLSEYGLNNQQVPLLQGITFPPERRPGVLKSLGPLAQAIFSINEQKFPNKLMNALRSSLQMLPMREELINAFRNASSPGAMAGLLKELGDVPLIATSRSTQKLYFPLCTWVFMWRDKGPTFFHWSASGGQMQALYRHLVVNEKIQYRIRSGDGSDHINQVIFHAIHGTHLDDISILPQISKSGSWKKRGEMSRTFTKRAAAPEVTHLHRSQ